jgi:hypothetical protein
MADTFALQQDLTGDIGSAIIVGGGYILMGTGGSSLIIRGGIVGYRQLLSPEGVGWQPVTGS